MYREKSVKAMSGWGWLVVNLGMYAAAVYSFIAALAGGLMPLLVFSILLLLAAIFVSAGFFIVNPNEAVVLLLFGAYKGTCRQNGFRFANPLLKKIKISLKARNLNGEKLKVNDLSGNPIEIAAVVVWQVQDTTEALFEVDDYEEYVTTQSEAAVRHLASAYPYDGADDRGELTLRGTTEEINEHLQRELQERLGRAGVQVIEARLSHLAYAPEIAHAMLQRQQAHAVVAARQKIVEGAVGMVEMALEQLSAKSLVVLDEERKASMVSNLLVVLCSEHAAQPVVNTGTLYQ
jgi:regulator of protease activity HflC (stomatin/prohibitin superfamily)